MYSFDSKESLAQFIASEVVNTSEAMAILNCSRQNVDDLVKRGKLKPIKTFPRDRIFFKSDVLERLNNK